MAITIQPFMWTESSNLNDGGNIDDSDEKCLEEIKAVLEKHHRGSKFGVALLHEHFEMDESEVLVETSDRCTRTLQTKPVAEDEAATMHAVTTLWRFDGSDTNCQGCVICEKDEHHGTG